MSSSRENSTRVVEPSNDSAQKRPFSTSSVAQNRRSTVGFTNSKPPIGSTNEPNKSTSQQTSSKETTGMKTYARKSQSYLRESKSRVESRYWQSSYSRTTPSMRRSSSAKLVREQSRSPTPEQRHQQPSPMFLNYSKLLAIEASFDCNNLEVKAEQADLNSTTEISVPHPDTLKFEEPLDNEVDVGFEARWLELPDELWLKILSFMKQSDLVNIGRTCKHLNQLYTDSSLCKNNKTYVKML